MKKGNLRKVNDKDMYNVGLHSQNKFASFSMIYFVLYKDKLKVLETETFLIEIEIEMLT